MIDAGLLTRPGAHRWWLLLVVLMAILALLTVTREAPVKAFDVQPVGSETPAPLTLTNVRAV